MNEQRPDNLYDDTVDTSREMSMQKAMLVLVRELEAKKVPRPDINPKRGIIKITLTLVVFAALFMALHFLSVNPLWGLPAVLVVFVLFSKKTAIWLILIYQKYAPEAVRAACVFTPTCSEYMKLAINKYGLIRGILKGTGRLLRCHYPNGGEDNP